MEQAVMHPQYYFSKSKLTSIRVFDEATAAAAVVEVF